LSNHTLVSFARRNSAVSNVINSLGRSRAQDILARFRPWLPSRARILDIGAGTAHVTEAVRSAGYEPVAFDLTDLRFVPEPLVLGNGVQLPFLDATFDISLLSTVMHHAPAKAHEAMLTEAVRVLRSGGRLLILEDIYDSKLEMILTRVVDAISNGQLFGEPHSNRRLDEWTSLIRSLGLKQVHAEQFFAWFGFIRIRQALIIVERG
jgi:ubiquinone/menaquinone biosynthesis C-methylase UbiE